MISVVDGTENRVKCVQCNKFIHESIPRHQCFDCKEYFVCVDCKTNVKHEHELIHEKAHPEKIKKEIRSGNSVCAVLCNAFKLWSKRPCLGYREIDSSGELKGEFKWLSYQETFERIKNFGFGLRQLVDPKDFVGIFGRNSIDWYIAFFSCFVNNIIGPVIPYNIGVDGVTHIVNHTKMKGLICDDTTVENALLVSKDTPSISFLIFIPNSVLTKPIIQEKYGHLIKSGLKIYSFNEVERMGKKSNSFMLVGNAKPDDVSTLIYTSGSTGVPKGVVVTEKYARKWIDSDITYGGYVIALRWSNNERESDLRAIVCGLRTAIYSRNVDLLFEDIQLAQPSSSNACVLEQNLLGV
jgi:long-chain acyl-CoA synthetase